MFEDFEMFEEFGEFGKFDASRSRGVRTEKKSMWQQTQAP